MILSLWLFTTHEWWLVTFPRHPYAFILNTQCSCYNIDFSFSCLLRFQLDQPFHVEALILQIMCEFSEESRCPTWLNYLSNQSQKFLNYTLKFTQLLRNEDREAVRRTRVSKPTAVSMVLLTPIRMDVIKYTSAFPQHQGNQKKER